MAGFIKKEQSYMQSAEVLKIQKIKSDLYEVKVKNYLFKKRHSYRKKTNSFCFLLLKIKEVLKTPGGIVLQVLRLNKFALFAFFLFFSCFVKTTIAESVQFVFVEEMKPKTIFLFPGRASLLSLPCPVTKALIGSPEDIKAEVDKLNPRDAHILLRKWKSEPSNLILKCRNKVFLFSLIPARNAHYDYVRVLAHVSSPPLKVKSALPNSPSLFKGVLREKDFTIRKILDFSWGDER